MKRFIASFSFDYDWTRAVADGLAFGATGAVALRVLPLISDAVTAILSRKPGFLRLP